MSHADIQYGKLVHACSDFIKMISRYFGRNFWKLKIKPLYMTANELAKTEENLYKG